MATNKQQFGTPFQATATGSTSATAFKAATVGRTYYVTDFAVGTDKSGASVQIKDGTTVIWQVGSLGAVAFSENFESPLFATSGASIVCVVDGTAACTANIAGFYLETP